MFYVFLFSFITNLQAKTSEINLRAKLFKQVVTQITLAKQTQQDSSFSTRVTEKKPLPKEELVLKEKTSSLNLPKKTPNI